MPVSVFGILTTVQIARSSMDIDVTFGAVEILDRLGVLGQAPGSEDVAHVHRQSVRSDLGLAAAAFVLDPQPGDDVRPC